MSAEPMTAVTPRRRWPISSAVLIVANVVPLLGVLTHHWTVFAVVLLYWCENVVVGVFNVLRMLFAQPQNALVQAGKAFLIPFFCVHYGMFTFVHGVFVFGLFGGGFKQGGFAGPGPHAVLEAVRQAGVGWGVAALIASHGFSFFHNYLAGGEYRLVGLPQLMMQPYARVVVLHLAIIGGGFFVMALGSPVLALALLIVLKTAIDLGAHLAERRKHGTLPPDQAVFATTSS
ncbi:MAG TPA: DUF6498-containing protein [Gemmatimonadales bacterium]